MIIHVLNVNYLVLLVNQLDLQNVKVVLQDFLYKLMIVSHLSSHVTPILKMVMLLVKVVLMVIILIIVMHAYLVMLIVKHAQINLHHIVQLVKMVIL